jgi:hypothetical protein
MRKKSEAHDALSLLFARDGVPAVMVVDGSKEQTLGKFRKKCREADCHVRQTEPYTPASNAAEGCIRELKRGVGRKMTRTKSPKPLWDHCLELEAHIRSNTCHDIYELNGEVPETIVSGQTSDISPFVEYEWYEWCFFFDSSVSFPKDKEILGRWLGPSTDVGSAMTYKLLKSNGEVVHRSTVRPLTRDEVMDPVCINQRGAFDKVIIATLGPAMVIDDLQEMNSDTPTYERYQDDDDGAAAPAPDADEVTSESLDTYLNADVRLPKGGTMTSARVRNRKRSADGSLQGTANPNPILDTRTYEVEFPDGEVHEYAANTIAENMWAQCDSEGRQHMLLGAIVGYQSDGHAVRFADRFVTVKGKRHLRKSTKGWHLCVEWKDGSTSWERLADLKESHPIEVAEYAVAQGIDHEVAFCWWVPYTLRKRNRIIAAVNKRVFKRTHKFGVKVPTTVAEAERFDKENGNTLWQDAIRKEMDSVRIAFKILNGTEAVPPGHQEITCHLIFDVKMEDFRRKARYVAGGHTTEAPATLTYASVVSRETVRIALTIAALNALEVKASDIQNAYLTAPITEKIWTKLGPEWGSDRGKKALIVRSLYGLKSAGASFRNHLADCMRTLGYEPCLADPDLWYKPMTRPDDGHKYYAYMLLYVDDCLCIHHDGVSALKELDHYFKMKKGSIGNPDIYLGAKLKEMVMPNGVRAWAMSPAKYVKEATNNVEARLLKEGRRLPRRATAPFPTGYAPELDTSPELNAADANHYQSEIGILRWMVEIGRVDIITEVSTLASHLALPREGHLDAVYHIFAYLKSKANSRMVFDPSYPTIDMSSFKKCDWRNFYGSAKEALPLNAPAPRGKDVDLRLYVDSSHADDKLTRRSRSGYFIFINSSPVNWLSRKQGTVETAVFGAEFVAMKQGVEAMRGLRYKLRMMGVPFEGPTYVYGDNMSVIHNTQRPESTLKKKSHSICYHFLRESVAMDESLTGHVSTHENMADLATKIIPGGQKRNHLVGMLLHDITEH